MPVAPLLLAFSFPNLEGLEKIVVFLLMLSVLVVCQAAQER